MAISDALIELLAFSKDDLKDLAKEFDKTVPQGDKFDIASALAQQTTLSELRRVAPAQLGAGRTSLSWVVLLPAGEDSDSTDGEGVEAQAQGGQEEESADEPLTSEALAIEEIRTALAMLTGKERPFDANLRPDEVTSDPCSSTLSTMEATWCSSPWLIAAPSVS